MDEEITLPKLPTWGDAASVTSYLVTIVGFVVAAITFVHPGFTEPTVVQALIPSVAGAVAGIAQIVNALTHRAAAVKVHVAARLAAAKPAV